MLAIISKIILGMMIFGCSFGIGFLTTSIIIALLDSKDEFEK